VRTAVVGAGLSGLVRARSLAARGDEVVVFD
jgi:phytoene dehydrogenase-like protein